MKDGLPKLPVTGRDMAKISVCMATHNGEKYLRRQLETILAQLGPDDEVVISDDSSTDATLDIINDLHDNRVRLFPGNTFFNPIFNFENALRRASGDVIALADQDDVWLDNKVAVIRARFAARPHPIYLIALDGWIAAEEEDAVTGTIFAQLKAGRGVLRNLVANRYQGCCLAFSRELLRVALPFPRLIPMHDMWLGMVGELWGKTEFVAEKTIIYRKHAASLTDTRIRFAPLTQLRWRWLLVWYLLRRRLERDAKPGSRL
jgi:glycosyltransferase involved in cell wall biosynthesis